jgi:hypothetical protein
MNYVKWGWVVGGIIIASIIDLVYMFWSRSSPGHNFHRAGWQAGTLGKGRYDIMKLGKVLHR